MMRMGHRIQVSVAIFLAALAAIMSSGPRARAQVSDYILDYAGHARSKERRRR
jgi:hypothetical protein